MSARATTATTGRRTILGVGTLILALAAGAGAQEAVEGGADARWLPFTGCWNGTTPAAEAADATDALDEMLCVRPAAGEEGVEFLTVIDGSVEDRQVRRAGARSPVSREGCEGWERTSFSDDGHRVYFRSEQTCRGGVERTTTGLMAMVSPYEWIDVRAVDVDGRGSRAWVRRYAEAPAGRVEDAGLGGIAAGLGMAVESARMAASSAPGVGAVIDASDAVDGTAVEAWIAELGDPMDVNADALVRMADAGVPEGVIDVVVAVSYPEHFDLEGGGAVAARGAERDRDRRYGARRSYGAGYYSAYRPFYGYHPYSYGGFYSSWYGYGGYGFYRGYRPAVVVVQPRDTGPRGRVVNGRGYTRSRSGGDGPSRSVVPGRRPSGGSISPAGASSGSGSSSTGRKAKKRGGSGGDGGDGGDGGGEGGLL